MSFKKIVGVMHLWLGLLSGSLVLFLGVTGCILAFELEIRRLTEPEQFVAVENRSVLPPSVLKPVAERALGGKQLNLLEYRRQGEAVVASYYDSVHYRLVLLHPYTGAVLKVKDMNRDFFRIVVNGHYYLWLPPSVGQPIVATGTLVFFLMILSGLILWWPRNKGAKKQRFRIKWSASWKRTNYDLHSVLGFYAGWVLVFIALTGLVMGFQWFARSVYFVSSGGKSLPLHEHPVSDTLLRGSHPPLYDRVWLDLKGKADSSETYGFYFPLTATDALEGYVNHRPGTYYNTDYYHYDQYTGSVLSATGVYSGRYAAASVGDKLARMNYDIHVGAIWGLSGKLLAFFASLIAASLPVTGFMLWRGRRRKGATG